MRELKRVCVFLGSSPGSRPEYAAAARALGTFLAAQRIGLVYGGVRVGLMGELADAALGAGGDVIGVVPQNIQEREIAHLGLTELRVVGSMHERKTIMADLSDGFIAMPGGIGTLEEIFEAATWTQLGIHDKPLAFLNVCGYYDRLRDFLHHAEEERFLRREHVTLLPVFDDPRALIDALRAFEPLRTEKWLDRDER